MRKATKPLALTILLTALFPGAPAPAFGVEAADQVLTKIADIRALPPAKVAAGLPVRVTGVVTWRYPGTTAVSFIVQDEGAGIWVSFPIRSGRNVWRGDESIVAGLKVGDRVEVEGITLGGGYAPDLAPATVRVLGAGELPEAVPVPPDSLLTGSHDARRVRMEIIVRRCETTAHGQQWVLLADGHGPNVRAVISPVAGLTPESIVDSAVAVTGVALSRCNAHLEIVGVSVESARAEDVKITPPASGDPFAALPLPVGRLRAFTPSGVNGSRRRITGIVTLSQPELVYLQGGDHGTRVSLTSPKQIFQVGDEVQAAGFVSLTGGVSELTDAVARRLRPRTAPQPVAVTVAQLLRSGGVEAYAKPGGVGSYDGRLIRLEGTLVEIQTTAGGHRLLLRDGENSFNAVVANSTGALPPLARDSTLRLTGVADLEYDLPPFSRAWGSVSGMSLRLRSPQDIAVLRTPSWWTPRRVAFLAGGIGILLLLVLVWTWFLQREVVRRGARLAAEISARQAATVEFETRLRERTRLAGDLHDTLEQELTGLALQLEATELFQDTEPERSARHLRLARQFLDRSREDVHRTVWDLRAYGLEGRCLADALRERTEAILAGGSVKFTLETAGDPLPLPDVIAGNLLLLAQEAVTNALKHARPRTITARLAFHPDGVTVTIADDGCGFDPGTAPGQGEGHFGLQGMRERIKRLGGTLRLESRPGAGTRLEASVPASALAAALPAEEAPLPVRTIAEARGT